MALRLAVFSYHTCPLASEEGKETGGMNVYVLELSRQLVKLGVTIDIFTRSQAQSNPEVVEVAEGLRVIHLQAGPAGGVPKKELLQYIPQFTRKYLDFVTKANLKYDLFHAHYYMSGMVVQHIFELTKVRVPFLMTFHTLALMKNLVARSEAEYEGSQRVHVEMELIKQADMIIGPSESDRQYLKYLYDADTKKVAVIPPGVDLKLFRPLPSAESKAKIGANVDHKIILFVGRIEPLKGIDSLIYALKILLVKYPEMPVCLWVVGGDISQEKSLWSAELQRLEGLRQLLGIPSAVHFLGQQHQHDLPYYYNAAEVVVMPSHYESFGMAAAEAMACGTPVLTTNVTGISTRLDAEHSAMVTSVNNPLLLASSIEKLLEKESTLADREKQKVSIRQRVEDLQWSDVAAKVLNVYKKVLSQIDEN